MTVRKALIRLAWGFGGLVVLIAAILGGLYLYLRTSLPQLDGTLAVAGLDAPITLRRDDYGIPHVTASNAHDAVFAIGFLHGQDRIFQMELLRRYGSGELAEAAGPSLVGRDRFMRTLGIAHAAEQQLQHLDPPVRQLLEAYADGVNAAIERHSGAKLPYYYFIPGPHRWQPVDSLIIRNVMALYLSQNYREELLHARLQQRLSPERMAVLFPHYPKDGLVTLPDLAAAYRALPLDRLARTLPAPSAWRYASNNWVLDGRHTASGKPILENDPHLTLTAPSLWYLLRVDFPGYQLEGGTIPGAPFLIVGTNGHAGWGFTETGGDVEDLFIEKIDPYDPSRYLTPEGSEPFSVRTEIIHVKGGHDVRLEVRSTRHGPVVSDVLSQTGGSEVFAGAGGRKSAAAPALPRSGYVMALEATWLASDDGTLEALWNIDLARSWDDFRNALRTFVAPQMNMVFAATDGTIGFIAPGRIPIRKQGYGWIPHPGWTGAYDWTGFIPFDALPQAVNPPSGRFVSANNKIVPDRYPHFLSADWAAPFRADRIAELLDARPKQTIDSTSAIAADTLSLAAHDLLPLMLAAPPRSDRDRWALGELRRWNDVMSDASAAPLVFNAWLRELNRSLFGAALGPDFADYWGPNVLPIRAVLTRDRDWCAPGEVPATADDCRAVLARSLHRALDELARRDGRAYRRWRWGAEHVATFLDPVISRIPLVGGLFALDAPAPGANDTIDAGIMQFSDASHPFADIGGPSLRMVLDFADLADSRFMVAPGVSGNPFSPYYGNLVQRWRRVEWVQFARMKVRHTLLLEPRSPARSRIGAAGRAGAASGRAPSRRFAGTPGRRLADCRTPSRWDAASRGSTPAARGRRSPRPRDHRRAS